MTGKNKAMWLRQSDVVQALGALAAQTALSIESMGAVTRRCRIAAIDVFLSIEGLTGFEGSKLLVGIADGSLSVAEIAEALQANPLDPYAVPTTEQSRRRVKLFGLFEVPGASAGVPILQGHFKVNQTSEEGIGHTLFVYNYSAAALTTGATVVGHWKAYCIGV